MQSPVFAVEPRLSLKLTSNAWIESDIQSHLDKVVNSLPFKQSQRQQRLLAYLVKAYLAGESNRIKGYTLALEVFDKGADFDPDSSALVRVEVGRLRSKLLEYYSQAPVEDPIVFELPKGKYQLLVQSRASAIEVATPATQDVAEKPSIAVLPLIDLSEKKDQAWFAEGMTEDLITDLSKISGLTVCSRYASQQVKPDEFKPSELAEALRVRYVLQGSVRRDSQRVRINVQLIDLKAEQLVWSERYDRPSDNALTVQGEVSECIVSQLRVKLTPLEQVRLGHLETSNSEAYEEFLKGMQLVWLHSETCNHQARIHFTRAIELDPNYGSAYACMTRTLVYDYTMRWNGADLSTLYQALDTIEAGLQVDGLLPIAHAMKSWVELWFSRYSNAIEAGRKAVSLDPNNTDARIFLSIALSLAQFGDEALVHSMVALKLNPRPTAFHLWVHGTAQVRNDLFVDAASTYQKAIKVGPGFLPNHIFLIHSLVKAGLRKEAEQAADQYRAQVGSNEVKIRSPLLKREGAIDWRTSVSQIGLDLVD